MRSGGIRTHNPNKRASANPRAATGIDCQDKLSVGQELNPRPPERLPVLMQLLVRNLLKILASNM